MQNLPNVVGDFKLHNPQKVERAMYGTPNEKGELSGGVAKEDGTYDEAALLAEYDRLGGYITRGTDKVKTGSFYDFRNKKPFEKPEIAFLFRVNGEEVEVPEGSELPGEVKASRILEESKKKKAAEKKAKKAAKDDE